MIETVFESMVDRLSTYFSNRYTTGDDFVIISNLANQDGSSAVTESDKVILTLANIQEESINNRPIGMNLLESPVNINIHVLVSTYFIEDNYQDSLKYLSGVISFFQANRVFNHSNTPGLDPEIDKVSFDIANMDIQGLSNLWGIIGGKYLPSVLYKVRMVPISEGNLTGDIPPFSGFNGSIR